MSLKDLWSLDNIEYLMEFLATFVGTIIIACRIFKRKLDKYLKDNSIPISRKIKNQTSIDSEIMKKLEICKEVLGADRIQVFEFHNSGHWANGRSALKMSCTYEVCRYGIVRWQNKLLGVPLACVTNFINTLLDDEYLDIKDLEEIKGNMPSSYNLQKAMKTKSSAGIIIHNIEGEPVGFVLISYMKTKNEVERDYNLDVAKKLVWFLEEKLSDSVL